MATVGLSISKEQNAAVSLGETAGDLTPEQRSDLNQQIGASFDDELPGFVRLAFGGKLDLARLVRLNGALRAGIRSRVATALGVRGTTGAGAGASAGVALGGVGGVSGPQSLGVALGLRGTGGAPAGADGTPLAGVRVAAGTDPGGIPGLTAGIVSEADAEALEIRASASSSIKASLGGVLENVLADSDLPAQQQQALKSELEPQINDALDDSFRSSFGPEPGFPQAMGSRILAAEIRMGLQGLWSATVEIDQLELDAEPPTGPFRFEIERVEFVGAVLPARGGRSQSGRTRLRMVGGAGGLQHEITPRNYAGGVTRVKTVVDDILRDCGETLSQESDQAILSKQIPAWQRTPSTGQRALDRIVAKVGATWRVVRDGTIWIGVDEWPEVEPDGVVEDDDWGDGVIAVAPDAPTMVPGIVVRGQRVSEVVHRLLPSGLRTELRAVGIRDVVVRHLEPVRQELDYAKRYRCKVVSQGADGRVEVLIDDERARGRGVGKCAIRVGLPGTTIKVPAGARCLVGWDDADPSLPYVDGWESGTAAGDAIITYPGGTRHAAGLGSMVRIVLPFVPLPAPGPPVPFAVFGFVETGNAQNVI